MASCRQVDSLLQAYVDGELSNAERVVLEQHLNECAACVGTLRHHQANAAFLFEVFSEFRLKGDLRQAVMAHLPEMEHFHTAYQTPRRFEHTRSWSQRVSSLMPAFAPALLLLLAFALWMFWPPMQAPGRTIGMVVQEEGSVTRSHEELPEWRNVDLGSTVRQDEMFETDSDGRLMIALGGRSELKVDFNSRVKLLGERKVQVDDGHIWLNVGKDERLFRVYTPSGDITVFGTTFDVAVLDNATVVTVATGRVEVQNDITFAALGPGQQVELAPEQYPLKPVQADPVTAMAWADGLVADEKAKALFDRTDLHEAARVMRAEQVFVLTPREKNISEVSALKFMWKPGAYESGHSSYDVHVSDTNMNPLFKKHLEGSLFDNPQVTLHMTELAEAEMKSVSGVSVLHIKVVPDTRTGRIETSFEVEALGN
ncbi:MAG: FecR domain-containing protein [Candidatus Hydrogenedentes bacterium]|nr:FecR domain-containing protein [Candidatus Hydrogenedentota bacterium]